MCLALGNYHNKGHEFSQRDTKYLDSGTGLHYWGLETPGDRKSIKIAIGKSPIHVSHQSPRSFADTRIKALWTSPGVLCSIEARRRDKSAHEQLPG